jgi:hypothetical protein
MSPTNVTGKIHWHDWFSKYKEVLDGTEKEATSHENHKAVPRWIRFTFVGFFRQYVIVNGVHGNPLHENNG